MNPWLGHFIFGAALVLIYAIQQWRHTNQVYELRNRPPQGYALMEYIGGRERAYLIPILYMVVYFLVFMIINANP